MRTFGASIAGIILAASAALAQDQACLARYRDEYLKTAGITPQEWRTVCANGQDPREYYILKLNMKQKADRDTALIRWSLGMPARDMKDDEIDAVLAIDPRSLPADIRDAARKRQSELRAMKVGAAPQGEATRAAIRKAEAKVKRLGQARYEEIKEDECYFISKITGCTLLELEGDPQWLFDSVDDPRLPMPRCFLSSQNLGGQPSMMWLYVDLYRQGARSKEDITGTPTLGMTSGIIKCR